MWDPRVEIFKVNQVIIIAHTFFELEYIINKQRIDISAYSVSTYYKMLFTHSKINLKMKTQLQFVLFYLFFDNSNKIVIPGVQCLGALNKKEEILI